LAIPSRSASERIQYTLGDGVKRLRAFFVRSPLLGGTPQHVNPFVANAPVIITRAQWGANESIRRNKKKGPKIADNVHLAIVHHTAGTNNYAFAVAAIVRIELTTRSGTAGTTSATTSSSTSTARSSGPLRRDGQGGRLRSRDGLQLRAVGGR
jgi:hypothetical protein